MGLRKAFESYDEPDGIPTEQQDWKFAKRCIVDAESQLASLMDELSSRFAILG